MLKAIVLDGEHRASLAVVRSISKRTASLAVATSIADGLATRSAGARSVQSCPAASESVAAYSSWLSGLPSTLVIPITDATTMLCRGRLLPDEGYLSLTDKANLLSIASRSHVPAPPSDVCMSVEAALIAASSMGFPVVLKPARSRLQIGDCIEATTVRVARNVFEVQEKLTKIRWLGQIPIIVQEFIPGHGAGIFCLYDRDHAVAWFAHKRIREKPPSGGVSVLCESVPVDPVLKDYAERLLRAAEYRGVAMVEFRIGTDGKPYLMEVNARFWGSLQLAIDCGVDFPWLYYQMLMGENVEPVTSYEVGRRLRWFLGDVDNLILQARDPALSWRTKAAALGRFIGTTFDPKSHNEVFRWSDPGPGLLELRQWVAGVMGRA